MPTPIYRGLYSTYLGVVDLLPVPLAGDDKVVQVVLLEISFSRSLTLTLRLGLFSALPLALLVGRLIGLDPKYQSQLSVSCSSGKEEAYFFSASPSGASSSAFRFSPTSASLTTVAGGPEASTEVVSAVAAIVSLSADIIG